MARTRYRAALDRIKLSDLPAAAMRAVWREGYTRADLRADVLAGLVVGIVALPLAMALAIAVGVAPQYGLYTSIVAGVVVVGGGLKVLILRLDKVPVMDATGLVALESAISTLTRHGCLTILIGLQRQPAQLVERAGLDQRPWRLKIRADLAARLTAALEAI